MKIRALAAVAVLASAFIHLWLWFDGVRDQGTVGALFLVNVVAGIVITGALVAWQDWQPLFLSAGFGVATIAAFLTSATVGLFGVEAGWSWYAWLAVVLEAAAVVLGVVGLRQEGHLTRFRHTGGVPRHGLRVRPR